MAETSRERSGQLVRKVFEILMRNPEGLPAQEILETTEREIEPTDFEKSYYPSKPGVRRGIRRFDRIVRFSTIAPVKAGWMTKNKGFWAITDEGRQAYEAFPDPGDFQREAVRLYKEWKAEQPDSREEPCVEVADDETTAAATLEEADEASWSEVETHLAKMSP